MNKLGETQGFYLGFKVEIENKENVELTHKYYTYDSGSTIRTNTNNAVIDMTGFNIRAFSVSASVATIKNLTIKNAKFTSVNSVAIYFNSSSAVENCNLV